MAVLGGEFAMILLVSGSSSASDLIPEMEEDAQQRALAAPVARIISQHVQNLTPDLLAD